MDLTFVNEFHRDKFRRSDTILDCDRQMDRQTEHGLTSPPTQFSWIHRQTDRHLYFCNVHNIVQRLKASLSSWNYVSLEATVC